MKFIQQTIGGSILVIIFGFIYMVIINPTPPPTSEEIAKKREDTISHFIKTDSNLDDEEVDYINSLPKDERQKFIPYRYQGQLVTQ